MECIEWSAVHNPCILDEVGQVVWASCILWSVRSLERCRSIFRCFKERFNELGVGVREIKEYCQPVHFADSGGWPWLRLRE